MNTSSRSMVVQLFDIFNKPTATPCHAGYVLALSNLLPPKLYQSIVACDDDSIVQHSGLEILLLPSLKVHRDTCFH